MVTQPRGGGQVSASSRGRGEASRCGPGRGMGPTCSRRLSNPSIRHVVHREEEEPTQALESESTTEPSVEEDSHVSRDQLLRLIRAEVQAVIGNPPPVSNPNG